jgi:hypothetical protein
VWTVEWTVEGRFCQLSTVHSAHSWRFGPSVTAHPSRGSKAHWIAAGSGLLQAVVEKSENYVDEQPVDEDIVLLDQPAHEATCCGDCSGVKRWSSGHAGSIVGDE